MELKNISWKTKYMPQLGWKIKLNKVLECSTEGKQKGKCVSL